MPHQHGHKEPGAKLESATPTSPSKHQPLAYRVGPFCELMGISRSHFYRLVRRGQIKTVRLGGRTLVPASEATRLLHGSGYLP